MNVQYHRSLLNTLEQHRKLLCTGVWGTCWGLSLALVVRSDVALASERATFAAAPSPRHGALLPGLGALTAHPRAVLPQSLVSTRLYTLLVAFFLPFFSNHCTYQLYNAYHNKNTSTLAFLHLMDKKINTNLLLSIRLIFSQCIIF